MSAKHLAVAGAMLGAIGMQMSGAKAWADVLTPAFFGGSLFAIGTALAALHVDPPTH